MIVETAHLLQLAILEEKKERKCVRISSVQIYIAQASLLIYTIGPPSLSVLLQLLAAQTCRLVYSKEGQNLLHSLCMSIIHNSGGWRNDTANNIIHSTSPNMLLLI